MIGNIIETIIVFFTAHTGLWALIMCQSAHYICYVQLVDSITKLEQA